MQAQQLKKKTSVKWQHRKAYSDQNRVLLIDKNVSLMFSSFKNFPVPNIITINGLNLQTMLFTGLITLQNQVLQGNSSVQL